MQRDRGKPGQKTKAITDPRGWFVKPLSRIDAQGGSQEGKIERLCGVRLLQNGVHKTDGTPMRVID
jgi:hypothetical protein